MSYGDREKNKETRCGIGFVPVPTCDEEIPARSRSSGRSLPGLCILIRGEQVGLLTGWLTGALEWVNTQHTEYRVDVYVCIYVLYPTNILSVTYLTFLLDKISYRKF